VNKTRQAPESAEIRAQEEVRTQDEEARRERDLGEDRIHEALETAAEVAEKTGGLGAPGRPVNRRSPFMIGLTAAFGVAVAFGLDLIPVIGSTIGGAVVSLVALTVSLPVALATLAFYIGYRLAEDYLIVPRIMAARCRSPRSSAWWRC
jgi:hypothetical protein